MKTKTKNIIKGSKIPITYLIDYIKDGYSITDFLSAYPWIRRTQVETALEDIKQRDFASRYAI
ncbi:DUF433 domain-containing protein [Candidatus Amesbacteria bacterium]|nr:DUF433 domain-containing protein [Candidatus Amesbacteria bacterium]MBI2587551.1 DUF433 domain-containing protein [Candidatus Amesbacteria bacterium]